MKLSPKAQQAMNKVVTRFQAGDLSPIVEIAKLQLPETAPARRWTFGNRVLAYAQTDSLDCRGFRQWQEVGRSVQKGERAAFILAPCLVKRETDDGEEETRLVGFRPLPVFAYAQTDGEPLPDGDYAPREMPPLADVAERLGVRVTWQPTPEDRMGDCTVDGSRVNVGTHDQKTFFHELAHAVRGKINGSLMSGDTAHEETVAEFTATVLMQLYGFGDRTGNTWRYINRFNRKDPLKAIVKALADVERVLEVLEV